MTTHTTPEGVVIALWMLDTRKWFPEAQTTKDLDVYAVRAMALLSPHGREKIKRYVQIRDAKMALASALLKPYAISRLHGTPFSTALKHISSDDFRKPFYKDPASDTHPVAFNVSHQAGIVILAAVANYPPLQAQVGVDVVCTSERRDRDLETVRTKGWGEFVESHSEVLGRGEVEYLKHQVLTIVSRTLGLPQNPTATNLADAKLRAFYALWALREAYIKLSGEALSATWLKDLEFKNFRPTRPTTAWNVPADEDPSAGEVIREWDIELHGEKVKDVNMCLRSMGPDYMLATAVKTMRRKEDGLSWPLGPYQELSLDEVLDYAEESG